MTGINSLLFLKILCDLERQKIETVPDEEFVQEACSSNEQLGENAKSPCIVKMYMQEKHGIGGSLGSKRYACPRCSCLFRRKRHLRQHLRFHCTHKCLGCSECFASIHRSFKGEAGENPEPLKTFFCSSCPTSFQTQAGLAIHQECHPQSDKVLECESCFQQFDNRWEFDRHQKSHVTSVVYDCKDCAKAFCTHSNLAKHVQARHRKSRVHYGDHFLAQLNVDPDSDMEHLDGHTEKHQEEYEDDSDTQQLVEASSKVCALCNQNFNTAQLNKAHVCSQFSLPESLSGEKFQQSSFQCPACSQIYSSFLALQMHCGAHSGVDPLTCTLCDKKFSRLKTVDDHFEFHGRRTCNKCGVFFYNKLVFLLHHCGYTQRCFICDLVFPTKSGYRKHLLVHPKPKNFVYKCIHCKKSFMKESYFRAHQIYHTGKQPFVCSVCSQKFLMYGPFKKHVMTHFKSARELEVHSMSHVIKTGNYSTESALAAHKSNCKVEAIEEASVPNLIRMSGFECDDCSKVFRKQHQLFIHLRDTHAKTPSYLFYCDLCSRGFYHKLHLDSHRKACSRRDDEERKQASEKMEQTKRNIFGRQFQCSKCGRKYFSQRHLNNHMYVHRDSSECPFQCALCGAGYTQEYYFKKHLDKCRETDPKKVKHSFKCKECGATFRNEHTLNRHTKAHGSEWECSLCKEKFITKRGYAVHKTLCTPEKAIYKTFRKPSKLPPIYTCPTCERTFQLKYRFEAHVASHQEISRHQCPTCFHDFMSITNFRRHKCKFQFKAEPVECKDDIIPPNPSSEN